MNIMLDVDGVVSNFVRGCTRLFGGHEDDIKSWNFFEAYGITETEFWDRIDKASPDFWSDLELYPWAKELHEACCSLGETTFLTSPSDHPTSHYGKAIWLKKHFKTAKTSLIGSRKTKCVGLQTVLLDDADHNCDQFVAAGGLAILFPRPWNANAAYSDRAMEYTLDRLFTLNGFCSPSVSHKTRFCNTSFPAF